MTKDEAINAIKNPANNGKTAEIVFLKADNSVRRMSILIGGDTTTLVNNPMKVGKPKPPNVVTVYEKGGSDGDGWKAFNKDRLLSVIFEGQIFNAAPIPVVSK